MTKKSWAKLILLVAPLVMLVIVLFQNIKAAPVALLFWEIEMSKSLLLILTFLLGAIFGILAGLQMSRSRRG